MSQYLVSDSTALGALLRGVRKARGLTQADLAQRAGLLPKTISALESGTGQVLVTTLLRCLSALQAQMLVASTEDATGGSWPGAKGIKPAANTSSAPRSRPPAKALKERW